jgi:hypothetical protein
MDEPSTQSQDGPEFQLFPPAWFVARYNATQAAYGLRPATALDPNVMMMWHFVTRPVPLPLAVVTGI